MLINNKKLEPPTTIKRDNFFASAHAQADVSSCVPMTGSETRMWLRKTLLKLVEGKRSLEQPVDTGLGFLDRQLGGSAEDNANSTSNRE